MSASRPLIRWATFGVFPLAASAAGGTFLDELAADVADSLGLEVGVDLFKHVRPDAPDLALTLVETGGAARDPEAPGDSRTVEALARATTYQEALALADSVHDLFLGDSGLAVGNFRVGAWWVHWAAPIARPGAIGVDDKGRELVAVNILFRLRS